MVWFGLVIVPPLLWGMVWILPVTVHGSKLSCHSNQCCGSGFRIHWSRIRIQHFSWVPGTSPDPGFKKAPDPESGSATLIFRITLLFNSHKFYGLKLHWEPYNIHKTVQDEIFFWKRTKLLKNSYSKNISRPLWRPGYVQRLNPSWDTVPLSKGCDDLGKGTRSCNVWSRASCSARIPRPATSYTASSGIGMSSFFYMYVQVHTSIPDPWHFCVDPDPDPRIHASD